MKTLVLYTPATREQGLSSGGKNAVTFTAFTAEKFVVSNDLDGNRRVEFVGGSLAGSVLYPGGAPFLISELR